MSLPWIARMAWRDGRHSWRRLLLYMSAILMGVAALVAIRSFGENLRLAVEEQAKILLGADLSIRGDAPFDEKAQALFRELGGEQARQTSFASMALFPRQQATRLVQVRAISGSFPFYGELKTDPPAAASSYQKGRFALVDQTLLLQFGVAVGDTVKLGDVIFTIAGELLEIPGESAIASDLAPRIFIPERYVPETGLVQVGSRVRYTAYFRFDRAFDVDARIKSLEDRLRDLNLRADTVEERKEDFRRELQNLNRFLGLVGFIAVVLGGIGIASSVHLYVRQRIGTIAVLRCVGATPRQSFSIYLLLAGAMGFIGALAGVLVGLVVQRALPYVLGRFIPLIVEQRVSGAAVAEGLLVGLFAALLFALIPLAPIRKISPLRTLRSDIEDSTSIRRDRLALSLVVAVVLWLLGFSLWYSPTWQIGLGFFAGLVVVFGLLFGVAKSIMLLTRRYFPSSWRYEWRQGLANLYRPHNQTVVLVLAVGLGTFFIVTLYLTQVTLLGEVTQVGSQNRPNLVLFDIQNDQLAGVRSLVEQQHLEVLQEVPVVTMRIQSVNGVPAEELQERREGEHGNWALRREYRCTYRDHLSDAEKLVAGELQPRAGQEIRVSLEERIARELRVGIGDHVTFDVQGLPVEVTVGSIRSVTWRTFQPNFFVLFPVGVLEDAPQFHVIVTRTDSRGQSAQLQRELIRQYPNVSAIDLSLVLDTIDSVLDRLSFVIRFMALFSILTGILVMITAIVSGRYQRLRESVLLRTLGASRRQIRRILLIEYFFMGLFSAATGLLLSVAASWALAELAFDTSFAFRPVVPVAVCLVVIALTILVGLSNSRGVLDHPPLEVLRSEE
ncbi:MAG: FtsX-like permease family protein [Acidobacteriota bacterium]